MNLIKTEKRCRMGANALNDHMRIHCEGPTIEDYVPDAAIDLYIVESPGGGWRHIHGHHPPNRTKVKSAEADAARPIVIDAESSDQIPGSSGGDMSD
jgi:hypothetical protein